MAVVSNIEWKLESAWITALSDNADLSAATIRRFMDVDSEASYPSVVVECSGSEQPPEWSKTVGHDIAFLELSAMTHRKDDPTGVTVANLIGAIRDSIRDVNALQLLNQEPGLTVYYHRVEGASSVLDSGRIRRRSITVVCGAVCTDVPDEVSSSSSSTSSQTLSTSSSSQSSTSSSSLSSLSSSTFSSTSTLSTSSSTSISSSSSSTVAGETTSSQSSTSESSAASSTSVSSSSTSSTSEST